MVCTRICTKDKLKSVAKDNVLLLSTIVAIILGVIVGVSLRQANLSHDAIIWVKIWGELFMRMLKLIILPMVMACLVVGLSNLEGKASGKLGVATLVWVFSTQIIGITLGLILATALHPGSPLGGDVPEVQDTTSYTDVFGDFLRNLFPDNIIQACLMNAYTVRKHGVKEVNEANSNNTVNVTVVTTELHYRNGMNTIGVVIFSLLVGFGIQAGGKKAKPLADFFNALNVVVFNIMGFILWYSPLGILSLVAGALVEVEDLGHAVGVMGMYIVTVLVGLALHQIIILPLIYFIFFRRNPYKVILHAIEGMLAGFAASSSAVGFPYLIKAAEGKLRVDSKVANFCLPIFTQINRDGSVLFMGVAIVFVAQTYGIAVTVGQYFTAGLLVTLLSVTLVAVPSSSIIVIIMIAGVINVPVNDRIGLLMAVEWLLDRARTQTNLESSAVGMCIIDKYCSQGSEANHEESIDEKMGPIGEDGDKEDDEEETEKTEGHSLLNNTSV